MPAPITSSLNGATRRPMICESIWEVISVFVWTSTSPLSASTMRAAVRRPTRDSARTAIFSTFASTSFSSSFAVSVLPAVTRGSRWRGGFTSSATRAPTCASGWSFTQALPSSNPRTSSPS